jgi:hypothetical protein
MENTKKYLDKNDVIAQIKYVDISPDDLINADNYDETLLLDKFLKYSINEQILLIKCAIHIGVVGSGNNTFGSIRGNDGNVIEIKSLFEKLNISHNKKLNEKYDKDTLSSRRLLRLFRYHIQNFIIKNNRPSYLWLKYGDNNKDKASVCFPGAEHIIDNKEDAIYLYKVYKNLDNIMKTRFCDRLKRVYIARKIFTFLELEEILN